MDNVLVIADCHCPGMLPGYVDFLLDIKKAWSCNRIVHIGDLVDWASISYHPKAPSLKNAELEFEKALNQVQTLYKAFPKVDWLIGNHDSLTERQANDLGLPLTVLKGYSDLWEVPTWKVYPRYSTLLIDDVIYQHGDKGRGGKFPAILNAEQEFTSVVQGHFHSAAGVQYLANSRTRIFGLQVGCGIDHDLEQFSYGKKFTKKPLIGCGVVLEGRMALFEPMDL